MAASIENMPISQIIEFCEGCDLLETPSQTDVSCVIQGVEGQRQAVKDGICFSAQAGDLIDVTMMPDGPRFVELVGS